MEHVICIHFRTFSSLRNENILFRLQKAIYSYFPPTKLKNGRKNKNPTFIDMAMNEQTLN